MPDKSPHAPVKRPRWTRRGSSPAIPSACYHPPAIPQPCKCAAAAIIGKQVLPHPLVITLPHYHTPYKRATVLSHTLVYHTPFMGPATCTFSPGLQFDPPGDAFLQLQNDITGVCYLVSYAVTHSPELGGFPYYIVACFVGRTSNKTTGECTGRVNQ